MATKSKKTNDTEKKKKKTYVLVHTVSTFHMQYLVEIDEDDPVEKAERIALSGTRDDWKQKHLGEQLLYSKTLSEKEMIKKMRKTGRGEWTDEQIISSVARLKNSFDAKQDDNPTEDEKKKESEGKDAKKDSKKKTA